MAQYNNPRDIKGEITRVGAWMNELIDELAAEHPGDIGFRCVCAQYVWDEIIDAAADCGAAHPPKPPLKLVR